MQILTGKVKKPLKIVIYGVEGIGKSTFASKFPDPLFIDVEDSTNELDVKRFPKPYDWEMLLQYITYVKSQPNICKTLVIDTADWAEMLCAENICSKQQISAIDDMNYGKGYPILSNAFGKMLNQLSTLRDMGINIVLTAHAKIRKFEQPDEMGAYDRWELKTTRNTMPLIKEWADIVLFANYKTISIAADEKGRKFKGQGSTRVMYATHHACWDAKNRHGLPDEMPFDYGQIAHLFADDSPSPQQPTPPATPAATPATPPATTTPTTTPATPFTSEMIESAPEHLLPVYALMEISDVTEADIRQAVASKGYYPLTTPITKYDPAFVSGVLEAAWPQLLETINQNRNCPF